MKLTTHNHSFYESIIVLSKCVQSVTRIRTLLIIDQEKLSDADAYFVLFQNIIILETTTFLDEFNIYFAKSAPPSERMRVQEFKKIVKPILSRINQWTDLTKFRNQIVAHNWRNKQGAFVIPDLNDYNIPRNRFEGLLLIDYLNYIWSLIMAEFPNEIIETMKYMQNKTPMDKPSPNYSNLNNELIEMASEVDALCKSLGRNYYLKVLNYQLEDL